MTGDIREHIKKLSPLMAEDSEIFRELSTFFGDGAKIETNRSDLSKFLGRKRLYRIIRIAGTSYIDGAWNQEDPEKWLSVIQIPIE